MSDPWTGCSDPLAVERDVRRLSDRVQTIAQEVALDPARRERIDATELIALEEDVASQQVHVARLRDPSVVRALRTLLSETRLDLDYIREDIGVTSLRMAHFLALLRRAD